jgi:hypothetical protein
MQVVIFDVVIERNQDEVIETKALVNDVGGSEEIREASSVIVEDDFEKFHPRAIGGRDEFADRSGSYMEE